MTGPEARPRPRPRGCAPTWRAGLRGRPPRQYGSNWFLPDGPKHRAQPERTARYGLIRRSGLAGVVGLPLDHASTIWKSESPHSPRKRCLVLPAIYHPVRQEVDVTRLVSTAPFLAPGLDPSSARNRASALTCLRVLLEFEKAGHPGSGCPLRPFQIGVPWIPAECRRVARHLPDEALEHILV